jgi:acyl-[acyl-carrier-protein]-phospholipid O-acyltransferase / long-chain-fatty-acid--[acyl-carrier-protein] ligase
MTEQNFDLALTRVSVFEALIRIRKIKGGKTPILEDHDRKVLSYDDIVRAAFALGGQIKKITKPGEHVGVLLPSGVGATVVFFALQAIGRKPAMLNFTAGALNLKAACAAGQIKTILSAERFIEQGNLQSLVKELSAQAEVVLLEKVRTKIGLPQKIGALIAGMAPGMFAAKAKPDDAAVILFTSGSFGAPRGVVLSHANLVANVEQAAAHIPFEPDWVFFNPLPMFHCFGLTGGCLLPILTGHKTFLYPSPLHFKEIPKLVQETGANVLFATDTFAQQYARQSRQGELKSLKFAVLGAERVKEETRELFSKKFGVPLLEGYGATEASPVVAVNQPADNRPGTVGKIMPGMEWRLEEVPGIKEGQKLLVKGPNVMLGYLRSDGSGIIDPPTDGWHDTGDVVSMTGDNFITIKGRVKRFAKVGGEMVSLAAVENYAAQVWPEHNHAAIALPCARKGERVILITNNVGASAGELLAWAQQAGAPEIAIPKKVIPIQEIPVLGSGKTDYVALQNMAKDIAGGEAEAA